jgi:hypothetical protein
MRYLSAVLLLAVILMTHDARADWAFDTIRSALKNKATNEELDELEDKYKNSIVEGEGYVFEVRDAADINGYDVQIVEDKKDLEKEMMMLGDVSVEVPAGSTYAGLAENLEAR